MINPEKIEELIKSGEGQNLEFKSSFNNELIETLVAFANTKGGRVIVGINQDNEISGISINPESVQNWVNEIKHKTSPSIIPDVEILQYEDKTLVILSVQEYPIKPVATRGKYFKRVANSNHLLHITEVVNLHLQSFNTSWDFHINNQFKIEDISLEKVQNSIDIINQSGLKVSDDPITFLIKNDLLRDGLLSNAAFLLFAQKDTVLTTIELGRFQTDTIIKDSLRTKSDILSQIDEVMDFVKKHINKEVIITDQSRNTQKWQYPLEAIREIISNMIIHRDYRSASDSIVKVYDERIEFYNPGRLPESITIEDLLSNNYKSTPRNKLIADFCKSIGLIEKYGSGIQRIMKYFSESNLPLPEFRNISEGFMVTVFVAVKRKDTDKFTHNQKEKSDVTKDVTKDVPKDVTKDVPKEIRLKNIVLFITEKPGITMNEMSQKCNVTIKTIKRDIELLKSRKLLKRIGDKRNGYWEIQAKQTD
jgi:ATP-dependent DNA helicase RecG